MTQDELHHELQKIIAQNPERIPAIPYAHVRTRGLYMRAFMLEEGGLYVGRRHKQQGQFDVTLGAYIQFDVEQGSAALMQQGQFGVTQPGTQRLMFAIANTVFKAYLPVPPEIDTEYPDFSEAGLPAFLDAIEEYFYEPINKSLPHIDWKTGDPSVPCLP